MAPVDFVFHVGFHKTATTWLQFEILPAHPDVVMQNPDPGRPWNDAFIHAIVKARDDDWDAARVRGLLRREVGRTTVVSAEDLAGIAVSGAGEAIRTAERLAAVAPDARVLLVLRNQVDLIESIWRTYVLLGWPGPLDALVQPDKLNQWWIPGFDAACWEYDRLVRAYYQRFGRERTTVLLYEDLVADKPAWIAEMWRGLGMADAPLPTDERRRNESITGFHAAALRRINMSLRSDLNPYGALRRTSLLGTCLRIACALAARFGPKRGFGLTSAQVAALTDRYRASNERVASLVGRDFSRFFAAVDRRRDGRSA